MAVRAINNFGELKYKVDLLFLIGKILQKQGNSDLAFKHFSLSKLIRQEEEWKIPQKLFDELRQFSQAEISNIANLKNELKKYWDTFIPNENKKDNKQKEDNLQGEVVRIADDERGKRGFLKSNGKEIRFFIPHSFHLTSKIVIGSNVIFKIIQAIDGKKKQVKIIKLRE